MNIGGLLSSVVNPANIALAMTGPGGWAMIAAKTIGSAIGQQVIQALGDQLGLPQSITNLAKHAFAAASGTQGMPDTIRGAVAELAEQYGLSPAQQGQLQRAANEDAGTLFNKLSEAAKDGEQQAKAKSKGRSWLQVIADSMGNALDAKVKDIDTKGSALENNKKSIKASTELQVATQEFSYMMNTASTVIKTLGEGLSGMARKQ